MAVALEACHAELCAERDAAKEDAFQHRSHADQAKPCVATRRSPPISHADVTGRLHLCSHHPDGSQMGGVRPRAEGRQDGTTGSLNIMTDCFELLPRIFELCDQDGRPLTYQIMAKGGAARAAAAAAALLAAWTISPTQRLTNDDHLVTVKRARVLVPT